MCIVRGRSDENLSCEIFSTKILDLAIYLYAMRVDADAHTCILGLFFGIGKRAKGIHILLQC